jgi:hypothetical protein
MTSALREAAVPFREQEPLSRHTSMGVGGPAAVMAFPRSPDELRTTLRLRGELGVPHRVLGGGSNLVVVDEGLDELVVNTEDMRRVDIGATGEVTAEGGANLIRTVVACGRAGWRGLESAVGIPGSVGGAAVMNAGAYGFSISDVMKEIVGLRRDGGAHRAAAGLDVPLPRLVDPRRLGGGVGESGPPPGRAGGDRERDPRADPTAGEEPARRAQCRLRLQEPLGGNPPAASSTSWASRELAGGARW